MLLGAAIGAAMGILFAPDKGRETRRRLFNSAEDLSDELKNRFGGKCKCGSNCEDPEKDNPV